jgi:hypothetical protein
VSRERLAFGVFAGKIVAGGLKRIDRRCKVSDGLRMT